MPAHEKPLVLKGLQWLQDHLPLHSSSEPILAQVIAELRDSMEANPTDPKTRCLLGVVLGKMGQPEASIEAWREAASLAPYDLDISTGLAIALSSAGRRDEAVTLFARLIGERPELRAQLLPLVPRTRKDSDGLSKVAPLFPAAPKSELTGDLEKFALPDLLEFLANQRARGKLNIESQTGEGTLALWDGFLTASASPNTSPLSELLLAAGAITEEELLFVKRGETRSESGMFWNCALVEHNIVPRDKVAAATRKQIQQSLREMLSWSTGRFFFHEFEIVHAVSPVFHQIAIDARVALLDAVRFNDENRLEAMAPHRAG